MSEGYRVLLACLEHVPTGTSWSSASWHEEAVLAELRSGEIVAAHKRAVADGYLEPIGRVIDGQWSPNMTRVRHEAGDGRWVALYRRTGLGQLQAPGQGALFA